MNRSLVYMIFGFGCIWLVLDYIYGSRYISQFVALILGESSGSTTHESSSGREHGGSEGSYGESSGGSEGGF